MRIKRQYLFIIFPVVLWIAGIFIIFFSSEEINATYKNKNYKDDIYINTPEDLITFSESVNGGEDYTGIYVALGNDIDMSGVPEFIPIGIWESGNYFCGVFDGRGHTIKNLTITTSLGNSNSGLFGTLAGTVCNLNMENCYIKGSACGAICSIAVDKYVRIYNCSVDHCVVDAPYTDIIGGQYLGKSENNIVDGKGNIDMLNDNLKNISSKCYGIAMNKWEKQDGKPVLSVNETEQALDMVMHIDSFSYTGDIKPYYSEEEQVYYFILPNNRLSGTAFLEFDDGTGKKENYSVDLSGYKEQEKSIFVSAGDEIIVSENAETEKDNSRQTYTVKICFTENTSSVFIYTDKRWVMDYLQSSKKKMASGHIEVLDENGETDYKGGLKKIHGRGNNSWNCPKKGFNIELMDNADLLGMGMETNFALLPGYRDASLLTYKVVQDLCKETGKEFAPEYRFVNVYVDGEYQGMYILAEKINIGNNRIDIDTGNQDVTGSYLFELDNIAYQDELNVFETDRHNIYTLKYPAVVGEEQIAYCRDFWNQFEYAVKSEGGCNEQGRHYTEYVDMDSLAQLWLYAEISGEYSLNASVYFYKESDSKGDGKLHVIYPWDVEHSFKDEVLMDRNVMLDINTDEANYLWYELYTHEDFRKAVYRNWIDVYRPAVVKLVNDENTGENPDGITSLSYYKEKYAVSSHYNELLWGEDQNIEVKADFIKRFLEKRIPYLDESLKVN